MCVSVCARSGEEQRSDKSALGCICKREMCTESGSLRASSDLWHTVAGVFLRGVVLFLVVVVQVFFGSGVWGGMPVGR